MASIQGVYVALFNRPADPAGLKFFSDATGNGKDLTKIGDLASTAEYQTRFTGKTPTEIVSSIYKSLFNRDAEPNGLSFFVDALTTGKQTINTIAINILDGAQGPDKTLVDLKISAADLFTSHIDTSAEIAAYNGTAAAALGRAYLTPVLTTLPSVTQVDAAIAGIVSAAGPGTGGVPGQTFTLTAGTDNFLPTATDAAFKTTPNDDTFRANVTPNSLNSADNIDAGGGDDTISALYTSALLTTVSPVLTNLENVFIQSVGGGVALSLNSSTGVKALWDDNSSSSLTASLALGTDVGLRGNIQGNVDFVYGSATGTEDKATLQVREATFTAAGKTVVINQIEHLTINESDDPATVAPNVSTIAALSTQARTIDVTGDGSLNLGGAASNFAKLTNLDASHHKGDMTFTVNVGTAPTQPLTVLPSAEGVNTITLKAGNGLPDTIQFTADNVSTVGKMTTVANFNQNAEDKLDLKAFSLGSDTTVGTTGATLTGDTAGFFTGTNRVVLNDATDTIYVDVNKDGNFSATTDLAIKITGVTAAGFTAADLVLA
ncbi:hypothetical protein ABEG18_06360 [Alsobacter sp. KACC 23698]|uniref:DUF4214 domain-containing protein n=1 Tax=Alsobacter sp. KACC 23698 TaxID=3149229 RepID=A0AAU7JJI8_9HYPH